MLGLYENEKQIFSNTKDTKRLIELKGKILANKSFYNLRRIEKEYNEFRIKVAKEIFAAVSDEIEVSEMFRLGGKHEGN